MALYITEFVGTFVTFEEEIGNTSGEEKSSYYPAEGIEITFAAETNISKRVDPPGFERDVIKGSVTKGKWSSRENFEKANFYLHEGILVSEAMKTNVPDPDQGGRTLFVSEAIILTTDESTGKKSMEHQLMWSDGDFGRWGCREPT